MPAHRKETPHRFCEHCGSKLERKRLPNGDLEYLIHFGRRKFCDRACMGAAFDARPPTANNSDANHYHSRKMIPKGPCSRCGALRGMDVHHKDGDHANNSLGNLERICRRCHLLAHSEKLSCSVCGRPAKGYGLCTLHYQRFKRHGDPLTVIVKPKAACSVCGMPAHAGGLCGRHYMQAKRASGSGD